MCVCVLPGSFRGMGAFYFKVENRRDIFNTTLMSKITAHEQKVTNGGLNISITFNYLETMQMSRQQPE